MLYVLYTRYSIFYILYCILHIIDFALYHVSIYYTTLPKAKKRGLPSPPLREIRYKKNLQEMILFCILTVDSEGLDNVL